MADPVDISVMPFPDSPPSFVPTTIRGTRLAYHNVNATAAGTLRRFSASLGSASKFVFGKKPVELIEGNGHRLYRPRLIVTFWGDYWAAPPTGKTDTVEVGNVVRAVQAIVGSSYLNHLTQYGPFQRAEVVSIKVVPAPRSSGEIKGTPDVFSDFSISGFVQTLIDKGMMSYHESDQLLYFVFMPPTSRSNDLAVGGHHSNTFRSPGHSGDVTGRYAWVATRGPKSLLKLDEITRVFSHELVEAATDPDGDGLQVAPPETTTWNEICDEGCGCASATGSVEDSVGRSVVVQKYWSRWHGRCVTGDEPEVPVA